jgi:hypothetical protein
MYIYFIARVCIQHKTKNAIDDGRRRRLLKPTKAYCTTYIQCMGFDRSSYPGSEFRGVMFKLWFKLRDRSCVTKFSNNPPGETNLFGTRMYVTCDIKVTTLVARFPSTGEMEQRRRHGGSKGSRRSRPVLKN